MLFSVCSPLSVFPFPSIPSSYPSILYYCFHPTILKYCFHCWLSPPSFSRFCFQRTFLCILSTNIHKHVHTILVRFFLSPQLGAVAQVLPYFIVLYLLKSFIYCFICFSELFSGTSFLPVLSQFLSMCHRAPLHFTCESR